MAKVITSPTGVSVTPARAVTSLRVPVLARTLPVTAGLRRRQSLRVPLWPTAAMLSTRAESGPAWRSTSAMRVQVIRL